MRGSNNSNSERRNIPRRNRRFLRSRSKDIPMFAGSAGVYGQGSQGPAHGRPQCVGPQENTGRPRTALQGALITTAGD